MSNLLQCLTSITDNMEILCRPLHKQGICLFGHDITFGKGEISILTNRQDMLNFYYENAFPAIRTTDEGRILAPGIYLTQNLAGYKDCSQAHTIISHKLNYTYAIYIVERDIDRQHVYYFAYNLNEADFLYVAMNTIGILQAFIHDYKKRATAVIEEGSLSKNRLILPYGELASKNLSTFSEFVTQELKKSNPLDFDIIFSATNEELGSHLTKRSYPIQLEFGVVNLSKMEILTLVHLLKGLHAGQIAQTIGIKQTTVESYLVNIKNKLVVDKKSELLHLLTNKKILQQVMI